MRSGVAPWVYVEPAEKLDCIDCTGDGSLWRLVPVFVSGSETDEERGVWDCEFDGDQDVVDEAAVPFDFSCFLLRELANRRRDIGFDEMGPVAPASE